VVATLLCHARHHQSAEEDLGACEELALGSEATREELGVLYMQSFSCGTLCVWGATMFTSSGATETAEHRIKFNEK
jgi:hypothetical protein